MLPIDYPFPLLWLLVFLRRPVPDCCKTRFGPHRRILRKVNNQTRLNIEVLSSGCRGIQPCSLSAIQVFESTDTLVALMPPYYCPFFFCLNGSYFLLLTSCPFLSCTYPILS